MNFTSNLFLFWFFPLFLIIYFILPYRKVKNVFLLIASIFFYFLGEPSFVFLLLFSVLFNYFAGKFLYRIKDNDQLRKIILITAIVYNIVILFIFKYLDFIINSFNSLFKTNIPLSNLSLPIGISFFTFQIMSYIFDLYYNKDDKKYYEDSIINLGMYIFLFPQLIAGPIVRYSQISHEIYNRNFSFRNVHNGMRLFILGLSKKVLIANSLGLVADRAFSIDPIDAGSSFLFLGALSYMIQIFFDFSGYSDMAIGIGKMIGFSFPQNFNYPYIATSVTDFWKRWHITLSSWFRDYVYIPLGGSKNGFRKTIINLLIVWFLTGLWHGANFTFILWGLLYFIFISFEKYIVYKTGHPIEKFLPVFITRLYTLIVVLVLWIIFRSDNIPSAFSYIAQMFNFTNKGLMPGQAIFYFKEFWIIYIIALLSSTKFFKVIGRLISKKFNRQIVSILKNILYISLLLLCIMHIVKGGYNPFIYFNF